MANKIKKKIKNRDECKNKNKTTIISQHFAAVVYGQEMNTTGFETLTRTISLINVPAEPRE